jgi:hypothetical protein
MPEENARATAVLAAGTAAVLLAISFVVFGLYGTIVRPRLEFDPQNPGFLYQRDVLSDKIDSVRADLFSPENVQRYWRGDGFEATFRILNDPRKNYELSDIQCGVEPWKTFAQTSNPARRQLVTQRQAEFQKCVADFTQELSILRSVEVGVDDTNGVNAELAEFVRRNVVGVVNSIIRATKKDQVQLVFFKLSDIDAYDHRTYILNKDTRTEDVQRAWAEGLDGWLLRKRGATSQSSIVRGLFNALSRNGSIRKRQVFVFSDGMENSPETMSFYRMISATAPLDSDALDARLANLAKFPDLKAAEVKWYFPPLRISNYKTVRDYWEHVLKDRCNSPGVEVLY